MGSSLKQLNSIPLSNNSVVHQNSKIEVYLMKFESEKYVYFIKNLNFRIFKRKPNC